MKLIVPTTSSKIAQWQKIMPRANCAASLALFQHLSLMMTANAYASMSIPHSRYMRLLRNTRSLATSTILLYISELGQTITVLKVLATYSADYTQEFSKNSEAGLTEKSDHQKLENVISNARYQIRMSCVAITMVAPSTAKIESKLTTASCQYPGLLARQE